MPQLDAKASGCVLTYADRSRVVTSTAIFMSFFSFGACIAALGAALPQIASEKGVKETSLGFIFIARGSGYLTGTVGSALLIEVSCLKDLKLLLAAIGTLLSGIALALMPYAPDLAGMYALIVLQGVGFGSIDSLCNIVLPEVWDLRVQPWMQAAHAHFGLGGILGPFMVGYLQYQAAFGMLAFISSLTLIITLLQMLHTHMTPSYTSVDDENPDESKVLNQNDIVSNNNSELVEVEMTLAVDRSNGNVKSKHANNEGGEGVAGGSESVQPLYPPLALKLLLASFFFVYVGIEIGYGGWISSYVILQGLTESHAEAAYISSVFFTLLAVGRLLAILLLVWISNTSMLRFQLAFSFFSAIFIASLGHSSYFLATVGAGLFGFACSMIFPLVMTVVGDYGFTMNASATVFFVLGSTFGEAIIPICMGFIMKYVSPQGMNICVLLSVLCMLAIYFAADRMMKTHSHHSSSSGSDGNTLVVTIVRSALHNKNEGDDISSGDVEKKL